MIDVVYQIQYSTVCYVLFLQGNVYTTLRRSTPHRLANGSRFGHLSVDVLLEGQLGGALKHVFCPRGKIFIKNIDFTTEVDPINIIFN